MKEKIKKWYEQGLWTVAMVRNAVIKGKLTEDEYREIVGEELYMESYSMVSSSGMSPLK